MEPIQVVGWEGVFGLIVTLMLTGILHAAVGRTPAGKGGYFDAREGFREVVHNRAIAVSSVLIMISIGYVDSDCFRRRAYVQTLTCNQWLQLLWLKCNPLNLRHLP